MLEFLSVVSPNRRRPGKSASPMGGKNEPSPMTHHAIRRLGEYLRSLPPFTWVFLGFFASFIFFFLIPIFFNASQTMAFPQYIQILSPIGRDFHVMVIASREWFQSGTFPTILYPPLTLFFFWPFTFLNGATGYKVLALIILACYFLTVLVFPLRLNKQKGIPAVATLVFITGLLSYGLQFELERGQWNLIAFTLSFAAIYLFHEHPRLRWLAYLLFVISVQLKLYPAIFVVALVDDWSDWKGNIKRFVGLGLASLAAMFILGIDPILRMTQSQGKIWYSYTPLSYNLSISSFVRHLLSLPHLPQKRIIIWLQKDPWFPQWMLIGSFALCLLFVIWQAYKKGLKGFNPGIFLVCTIGALIIPSISFDYKLALLPAAVAVWLPAVFSLEAGTKKSLAMPLIFLFSLAYASLLYPPTNKPDWLSYNFPILLLLLLIVIGLSFMQLAPVAETLPVSSETEVADQSRDSNPGPTTSESASH